MKNAAVILILVGLAVGGGFLLTKDDGDQSQKSSSSTQTNQPSQKTGAGTYIDYSPDAIVKTSGTKILFFYAPWCSQCRALEKDIKEKGVPDDVTIIKVDYDTNQSLRQKYGVTIQTTLVKIDDNGNLIEKYVAYDEPTIDSVKKNLLD